MLITYNMESNRELYNIYSVDVCFELCAMDVVLVGAKSKDDLIEHIKDVFPDSDYEIQDYDVDEFGEYPDNKVGDIVKIPQYTEEQFNEICHDDDSVYSRIQHIPHMFTDIPYVILDSYGYME